jgi:hypothetical protein
MQNTKPTAHIAVNKSRLKHYEGKVYLKNGQHFQIELFNPTKNKVLAEISINGNLISSGGIIIPPGKREFLERWIEDAKKFIFEIYEVENSEEVKEAISENGKVTVNFYGEDFSHLWNKQEIIWHPSPWNHPNIGQPYWITLQPYYYINTTKLSTSNTTYDTGIVNCYYTSSVENISKNSVTIKSIETGRAEKGTPSNQNLHVDNSTRFNSFPLETVTVQILPISMKPIEITEIRSYCTSCGIRIKKAWKFCPKCGVACE